MYLIDKLALWESYRSGFTALGSIAVSTLLLIAILVLGWRVLAIIWRHLSFFDVVAFAFPLGAGIYTFTLFLVSWVGITLTATTMTILLLLLISAAWFVARRWGAFSRLSGQPEMATIECFGLGALLIIAAAAAFISIGRGHSTYDVTAGWAIKGYGIALEGDVKAGGDWGMWGLAYPLNIHLLNAIFQLISGDSGPFSKLVPVLYFSTALMTTYWFWRQVQVHTSLRLAAILFLALHPLLFLHATMGLANLPFTSMIIGAVLVLLAGFSTEDKGNQILGGLLLGIASWTRAEGIGYTLAILIGYFVLLLFRSGMGAWRPFGRVATTSFAFSIPWVLFGWTAVERSHLGVAMKGVLPSVLEGDLNLPFLRLIPSLYISRSLHPENNGYFIPAALLLLVFGSFAIIRWRSIQKWGLALFSVMLSSIPIGLFYVRSFTREEDFQALLTRSFDRAFFPGFFMIMILAVVSFNDFIIAENNSREKSSKFSGENAEN